MVVREPAVVPADSVTERTLSTGEFELTPFNSVTYISVLVGALEAEHVTVVEPPLTFIAR